MVGVPGRSKTCATCRSRKKGCDFERPSCRRCREASLVCGGYERARIFINSTANSHPSASARGSSPLVTSGGDVRPYVRSRHGGTRVVSPDITILPESRSLLRSAHHELCIGQFWQAYMPNGRAFPASAASYASGTWTNIARDLCSDNKLLRMALYANALSKLSQQKRSPFLMMKGFQAYSIAADAFQKSPVANSDATLAAARLMLMYTITHKMKTTGDWTDHGTRILCMLRARGPHAFSSGNAHQIFADFRLPIAIAHVRARKACELSHPAWKTIPWTGRTKLPKDHLIDIMVDVPGLLQDLDRLQDYDDGEDARALKNNLEQRCLRHDQDLDAWHEKHAPKAWYDIIVYQNGEPGSADELSVVYIMSVAWAVAILLHSILRTLGVQPDRLPKQSSIATYLREIAMCTRCFLHPSMGVFGMEMAVFPLGLALQFLADPSGDREPMHEERCMFRDIAKLKGGEQIMRALSSMRGDSSTPKPSTGDSTKLVEKQWVGAWPFLDKRKGSKIGEASRGALLLRTRT